VQVNGLHRRCVRLVLLRVSKASQRGPEGDARKHHGQGAGPGRAFAVVDRGFGHGLIKT